MSTARTIVVSGAGTGIGRAVARKLAATGNHVTAVGRRQQPLDRLEADADGEIGVIATDVSTERGAMSVADQVASAGLACAGVVNAAGGIAGAVPGADGLAGIRLDWQASFESNVLTALLLTEALREQLERDAGRVVLISSVAALRGSGGGPYGAMKAALHGWVYDLAAELGPKGGTANVVAPGFVPDTEFWAGRLTADSRQRRAAQTLVGREGAPDEVASMIAWLLGPDGGWVTGQIISPNGGVVLGR
ncbi:MAG: SDR family oxidoreductase [Nocardiopsaceae bacterium]|jgi:3-oxoacyl-[acyl-carrier protein] reductase|nr:SDR family oxidoreductase [Nocardiopsaceae bacterium]